MKIISIICAALTLASCAAPVYQEPTSGPTAKLYIDGSKMTPTPFSPRKVYLEVYDQCYETSASEGLMGATVIKEPDFKNKAVTIPANGEMFISYGIYNHCMVNWGLTPKPDGEYIAVFDNVFAGCEGALFRLEEGKPVKEESAKFLKLSDAQRIFGNSNSWRKCKNIPK